MKTKPLTTQEPAGDDALMGAQLTEQYHRAIGGMTEVLKFGAMMMRLREHIESTRGLDHASTTGKGAKYEPDTGVAAWLKQHAPDVKKATAYRFLNVAESVAEQFHTPARISFVELATKPREELSERHQAKQLELWDFVNGTSQRSWLDRFKPPLPRGGARNTGKELYRRTKEEIAREEFEAQAETLCIRVKTALDSLSTVKGPKDERGWWILPDDELEALKLAAMDLYHGCRDYQAHRKAVAKGGAK